MSVRIPVSADASGAVQAIQVLQRALERAGQAGRSFAELDLSHPELKQHAKDIETIRDNLDHLINAASGRTAAIARQVLGASFGQMFGSNGFFDSQRWHRLNPDDGARLYGNATRHILRGTRWDAPHPAQHPSGPAAPQGGAGGGGGGGGGGDTIAAFGQFGLRAAGALGAAISVHTLISAARDAERSAREEAVDNSDLMRTLRDIPDDFRRLRDSVRDASKGIDITYAEAQRFSHAWVRASSEADGAITARNMRFAVGAGRSLGLDSSTTVGGMGRAAFMGEDPRRFAVLLAETMRDAGLTGQGEAVMGQLLRWTEGITRNNADPAGLTRAAEMWAALSSSGTPGLRGEFGANIIDRINASLTQGGAAGDPGRHLLHRAFARRGITDPYAIQHTLEGGMFERVGSGDNAPTVFEAAMDQLRREYAGQPDLVRWHAGGRLLGINSRQFQAMEAARGRGGNIGRLGQILSQLGIAPGSMNPMALQEAAEIAGARTEHLGEWRTRVQGNINIPEADWRRLGTMEGDDLRREMIRLLAQHGRARNEGDEVRRTLVDQANAYNAVGDKFLEAGNTLRDASTGFMRGVETLGDTFRAYILGDQEAAQRLELQRQAVRSVFATGGAGASGGGGAPTTDDFMRNLEAAEGGAEGDAAANPRSTARGAHQFTEGTFLSVARRFGGDRIRGMTDAQILALRHDREFSRAMARAHIDNDIVPSMTRAGVQDSALSRYAGWHFGAAGGAAVMRADGGAMMGAVLDHSAIAANPYLAGMTVQQWRERFSRRFSPNPMPREQYGPPAPTVPAETPGSGAIPGPRGEERQQHSFRMDPVRVIHETATGEVLREEMAPVTYSGGNARPWGLA